MLGAGLVSLAAVALLLIGLAQFRFGSVDSALAAMRGDSISAQPLLLDVGNGDPGEERESVLTVTNHSETVVNIVGGSSDCSCVTTVDLPVAIGAHESRSIRVRVRLPAMPGIFTRKVLLWTDMAEVGRIPFMLTGRATAPAKATTRAGED